MKPSRIDFHHQADLDYEEQLQYWGAKKPGAAEQFRDSITLTLEAILTHPFIYRKLRDNVRLARNGRYNLSIYFMIVDDAVIVLAIISAIVSEERIQRKLGQTGH